jgi:type VI secretion system protein ImpK
MKETVLEARTLPQLSTDLLLLVFRLKAARGLGEFETLYQNTEKLFESFELQAKGQGIDVEDVTTAKYGLAAFVDETVLNSPWPNKDRWADNPLQLNYFGTYLAGENFFDKLDEIRSRAETKADLLEVYYLCLLLGFRGKYGVGGQEKLRTLIDNVAMELSRVKPAGQWVLSPHWKIPDGPQAPPSDKLPRWVVLACWGILAAGIILYLALFFMIRSDAQSQKEKIRTQTSDAQPVGLPRHAT